MSKHDELSEIWEQHATGTVTPKALDKSIYDSGLDAFAGVDRDMVVVNTDGSIQFGRFIMERNGLSTQGNISKEDWLAFGQRLSELKDSIQWILGDWANLGMEHALEWVDDSDEALHHIDTGREDSKYQALLTYTPYAYQTLRNFAYVARSIPMERRRENLSFTHHAEVAPRDAQEQEQLLDRAEKEGLSTRQLRELMHPKVIAPPMDIFEDNLKSFRRRQRSLAKKVAPHQRQQMAIYLRQLADEIEGLGK